MTDSPIRLAFPVSADDQRRAAHAMLEQHPMLRALRLGALVLPFLMIAWSWSSGWPLPVAIFRNFFWIVFAALFVLLGVPMNVRSLVKAMRRADPQWDSEQALLLDDEGIHLLTPPLLLDVPWQQVDWAVETKGVFLLRLGKPRLLFIPVRVAIAQQVLDPLRRLLRSRLGSRARLK